MVRFVFTQWLLPAEPVVVKHFPISTKVRSLNVARAMDPVDFKMISQLNELFVWKIMIMMIRFGVIHLKECEDY